MVIVIFLLKCESCDVIQGNSGISEGIIHYDVTYPYYDGFAKEMLPDEMTFTFKEGKYLTQLSSGSMFSTQFYSNNATHTLIHTLQFLQSLHMVEHSEQTTADMLAQLPQFTIIKTSETDIATFDAVDQPDMDIYYTNEISLEGVNWCNQFSQINGVLMAYETEQFGLRTRYQARLVEEAEIDDATFNITEDYISVSPEEMHVKLASLFSNLN